MNQEKIKDEVLNDFKDLVRPSEIAEEIMLTFSDKNEYKSMEYVEMKVTILLTRLQLTTDYLEELVTSYRKIYGNLDIGQKKVLGETEEKEEE